MNNHYIECNNDFRNRFSGIGALRVPNIPKEFESFQGKIIHSAYWDLDYDLTNKRVAVIGSGTRYFFTNTSESEIPSNQCTYF